MFKKVRYTALRICLMLFYLQGCSSWSTDSDLRFANTAFQSLAGGYSSAEQVIDWETFKSMGENIFKDYAALTNDMDKEGFRKSFIKSFSSSFQSSGGSADNLKNWRILEKDSTKTLVAADIPNNRSILITVINRAGKQKISSLDVK
jgi:hypothetical protein